MGENYLELGDLPNAKKFLDAGMKEAIRKDSGKWISRGNELLKKINEKS